MAFDEKLRIPSPTGASLNAYRKAPTSAPRGVVQINHGLAEHAARYERFADFLAAQGFHVYAHDHRGHGETTAPDAPPRLFGGRALDPDRIADGAGKVIADVVAVQDRIADDHPGLPLIVFGHSMGGLIALNVLARHSDRVAAAAIWNANFSAGLLGRIAQTILAWEMFRLGSDVPSRMLPRLTAAAAGDEAFGIFHLTGSPWTTWHGFAEAIFEGAAARGLKTPELRAIATADYPTPARRPADGRLDCSRIARIHGIQPADWRQSLSRCLDALIGPMETHKA